MKRILIPVLAVHSDKFWSKPEGLKVDLPEQDIASKMLPRFVGQKMSDAFLQLIYSGDLKGISHLRKKLRWAATLRATLRNPPGIASRVWQKGRLQLRQFVSPCGPIVALVGVDGVGKSTAIEAYCRNPSTAFSHAKALVKHWRPGLLPPLGVFLGRTEPVQGQGVVPRRTPGAFHWLRLIYYLVTTK